ncbi:ABC transporter ATP-binding protein [Streptomyces sp. MP131-18]|uniref:dipeptide ABC transporter ATP-binding protein n=1 Tax=Streptomyces sp. MP131-18 TaxID=1857892 RepID=UPI00097C4C83|nr:ABC transporter ATP-binding protein [Streptomyces sp. MP131-18]ONK15938.1 Glutathione import ATP-binding protein GsiA [Streptomyces sp. MP131-18]
MAQHHAAPAAPPLLRISGLGVAFGGTAAVRDASWEVRPGEIVGLVGESGSGKSATGLAVLGLHGPHARVTGSIRLDGRELAGADEKTLRGIRGRRVAMIFQDALDALNPYRTVGAQLAEAYRLHHDAGRAAARERAVELLERVGIDRPAQRAREYPHQFSGGMRQRVMIALALVNEPELIIADEPTTALDATVQAQVLGQLVRLQRETGIAVVLITHDFGVIEQVCDRVVVMYRGRVVEQGPTRRVLGGAVHPYTRALVASVPSMDDAPGRPLPTVPEVIGRLMGEVDEERLADPALRVPEGAPRTAPEPADEPADAAEPAAAAGGTAAEGGALLSVRDLTVTYPVGLRRSHTAVRGVSFDIAPGETFGLVGESGSGKSTVSRVLLGLKQPAAGQVLLDGEDITRLGRRGRRRLAPRVQMVFQDPYGSLNPDRRVGDTVGAGLALHTGLGRAERRARVADLLTEVGLDPALADAYPGRLSGGMRQRVGIARALALEPALLIADEPVSALDVSVQAQVLNLLSDLRRRRGLAMLFVSHDLTVVRHMSSRIAVMRAGEIVEAGDRDQIMESPASDYTRALLDAGYSISRAGRAA